MGALGSQWALRCRGVITTLLLWLTSYNGYDRGLALSTRVGLSILCGLAIQFLVKRPVLSLFALVGLSVVVGSAAPALASVEILVVIAIFVVTWKTDFPLVATLALGVFAITVMYAEKLSGAGKGFQLDTLLQGLLVSGLGVAFGSQTRRLRVANEQLVELAEVDRRHAVLEERRRIAREIHDVAAHHLSAVVVKSKLASRLDTAEDLRAANNFAATSASEALNSMRTLVGVLSDAEGEAPLVPQPRLDELVAISERMAGAGLIIDMRIDEALPALTRQVELAVVRIVQEALTNVLKHRGPGPAWVSVTAPNELAVVIDDDGTSPGVRVGVGDGYANGHGLLSMRERAAACGGQLNIEPSPRGGWRVAAMIPIL